MVAIPEVMPVTMPVAEPTEATEELLEAHTPPADASAKVTVVPAHKVFRPVILSIPSSMLTSAVV